MSSFFSSSLSSFFLREDEVRLTSPFPEEERLTSLLPEVLPEADLDLLLLLEDDDSSLSFVVVLVADLSRLDDDDDFDVDGAAGDAASS